MDKESIINELYELADMDISAFPIGKGYWDKKIQAYTYKKPGIESWLPFKERVPTEEEIESWEQLSEVNGIALVTGVVSNIVCIDVDTNDKEIEDRILKLLPNTPCVVMGNPSRAGKYIYKMYDDIDKIPMEKKRNLKGVDILCGNSYICIPKGRHSSLGDVVHPYSWKYKSIIDCWDDIPVMPALLPDQIEMALDGKTTQEIAANMPTANDVNTGNELRNNNMVRAASDLIRKKTPVDQAIQTLIDFDLEHFSDDLFFTDKSKGHKHKDVGLNARIFYTKLLDSINRKKGVGEALELPEQTTLSGIDEKGEVWPEPLEVDTLISYPKFDYDLIPNSITKTVKEISELNAVSPQNVFLYMLGTFSATVGNKVLLKPYINNKKFLQACNLYVGIVAASGERKSQTTQQAKLPLIAIHKRQLLEYKEQENEFRDHNDAVGFRSNQLRKNREEIVKKEGPDNEDAKEILKELQENEERKIVIKKKSLYEQENTTEKNYEITGENPNGFFIEYNEWGCAYAKFQNKDNASLRRYILDGWDGDAMLSYKTKHQGEQYIEKYCLSVGFSVQLSVIQEQIWNLQRSTDDGLLPRFLLAISDSADKPVMDYSTEIDSSLMELFSTSNDIEESDIPIAFTEEASLAWQTFQRILNTEIKSIEDITLSSFRSKHVGLVVRISGLIAIINNNGNKPDFISLDNFEQAEKIINYVWASTKALFNSALKTLLERIILEIKMTSIPAEIYVSDLMKAHAHLFSKDASRAMELLRMLHDLNIVRFDMASKRATMVRFNPKLFEQ